MTPRVAAAPPPRAPAGKPRGEEASRGGAEGCLGSTCAGAEDPRGPEAEGRKEWREPGLGERGLHGRLPSCEVRYEVALDSTPRGPRDEASKAFGAFKGGLGPSGGGMLRPVMRSLELISCSPFNTYHFHEHTSGLLQVPIYQQIFRDLVVSVKYQNDHMIIGGKGRRRPSHRIGVHFSYGQLLGNTPSTSFDEAPALYGKKVELRLCPDCWAYSTILPFWVVSALLSILYSYLLDQQYHTVLVILVLHWAFIQIHPPWKWV
ncbi:uncharacterized protein LOC122732168 [Dromiciops gliroides]|uniref:uncharacterized protein LOC122732168 n=1 Tax=Dromiciops gliroides TaxID=33562 RepID=UPI001CC537FC|nr:uncharacterized protein LOC122732168 [Dromiciops gliroides]